MATKVKEIVMYEAIDGSLYDSKAEAEAANLVLEGTENAMIELDRLMNCSERFFETDKYEISMFIIENRKNLIKFLKF